MNRVLTVAELTEMFDVDKRTVDRWVSRGCPCDGGGKGRPRKFNGEEVAAWMKREGITGEPGRPSDVAESTDPEDPLRKQKIRKETALADRYELMVARERGLLVPKADVQAENVRKFTTIRNRLLGLPASAAPAMDGLSVADAQRYLDDRVREILQELSK